MSEIFDLMETQNEVFEKQMALVIRRLTRKINNILDKFKTDDGKLLIGENVNRTLLISRDLEKALRDSGYYELAEKTLKQNKRLMDLRIGELKDVLGRKRLGGIDTTTLNGLLKMNFEGMKGLSAININGIRETIFNSVNLGLPVSTLREELIGKLGAFEQHAKTYIRTGKRIFTQQVEDNVSDNIKFGEDKEEDFYEYIGAPLQHNSHKECIYVLTQRPDNLFTQAEKDDFDNGIVDGISFDPMRWNCQHMLAISNRKRENV